MPIAREKIYYDQIDGVVDAATEQHKHALLVSFWAAAQKRRENWRSFAAADATVEQLVEQMVRILDEADAVLSPDQVRALEAHVHKRLTSAEPTTISERIEESRALPQFEQTAFFTGEPLPVETLMTLQGVETRRGPTSIVPEDVSDDELDAFLRAVEDL